MAYVGKKKFGMTDAGMEASYNLAGETNTPITGVNEFGKDVMENQFGEPLMPPKKRNNISQLKPYTLNRGI